MFRDLKAAEVECRVGQASEKGLSLLLYKDARVDMAILDETVGQENWQCRFYEHKGILFCSLGVRIHGEWIWKDDAGSESNTEAEKGNASDARKRAAVCFGIGRELYTSPFVWVNKDDCNIKVVQVNNKTVYRCNDTFIVSKIDIKDKVIVGLEITNSNTKKVVYTYGTCKGGAKPAETPKKPQEQAKPVTPAVDTSLEAERQWAINLTVTVGVHAGKTLGTIYKTDKAVFDALANNPPSEDIKKACAIIREWVKK